MSAAQDELELRNEEAGIKTGSLFARVWKWFAAFFLVCVFVSPAHAQWTVKGFNFRSTAGYVTDGTDETYVLGETSSTTRDGATWQWSACADCKRDRDNAIDRRLAGFNGKSNADGTQSTWTLTLPQAGTYTVCIAMGDATNDQIYQRADIYDDASLKFSIIDTNGTEFGHYTDAAGNDHTAANFFTNQTCQTGVEFASTSFIIKLGATSAQSNQSTLSHVYLELEEEEPTEVVTEFDFDTLGNCTTGQESNCLTDNDLGSDDLVAPASGFRIKSGSHFGVTPPVGDSSSGIICGSGDASSTGAGYMDIAIPGGGTSAGCIGQYVYFGRGWMQNVSTTGNHTMALKWSDGDECLGYVSLDFTLDDPRIIVEVNDADSCGTNAPSSFNLGMNSGNWRPKNNQWYWVELCSTLNTTASGTGGDDGNGTVRLYVDEDLLLEYTDVNMQGNAGPAEYDSVFGPRSYMGFGVPRWQPLICFDHMKITSGGETPAGPEAGDTLGTGDGPYFYYVAGDGMEEQKLSNDCSATGSGTKYISSNWSESWESGATFVNSPDNNDYACNTASGACDGQSGRGTCTTSKSMAATTDAANDGAGVYFAAGDLMSSVTTTTANAIHIHGHIYLDNLPSVQMAFAGLAKCANTNCSAGSSAVTNFLALSVVDGKWALLPKTAGSVGTALDSGITALADTWVQFEIAVDEDNDCSLAIESTDGMYWRVDEVDCGQNVAGWAFADSTRFPVIGIIDSQTESNSFTANYDDVGGIGAASFFSSKNWDSASVPSGFASGVAPEPGEDDAGALENLLNLLCKRRRR